MADEDPKPAAPGGEIDEEPAEEASAFALVAQFFVIPLIVVVLAVGIFLVFGYVTREKRSPGEYLAEVRTGSANRRWQAAYEMSLLLARDPKLASNDELFRDTLRTFEGAKDEPQARRYLALALGRFARAEAAPALGQALGDEDEETRIYAAVALGSIRDPAGVAPLIAALGTDQPTLRKTAAFALGAIGDRRAVEPLKVVADDPRADVALQGALSLAQLGDGYGAGTLRQALDRARLQAAVEMRPEQASEAMVSAIRGLVLLDDRASAERLRQLAHDDPDLRVRAAAIEAAAKLGG